jgi:hypothetical protein
MGPNVRVFQGHWTEKSKLASMLVIWSTRGPRVPMAWVGCVGAAGHPVGCQIGHLTRHETPLRLARPSQATKISKPNRFAYPFRSRPRGVCGPPILNLRPHHTSSYRDTANLGFGVTPRPGRDSDYFGSGVAHCRRKPYEWCRVLLATRRASNVATMWSTSSVSKSIRIGAATRMAAPLPLAVRSTSTT